MMNGQNRSESSYHPHCINVMLEDGQVGRVQEIVE